MNPRTVLRRALELHRSPVGAGWATRTFVRSMSGASLLGVVLFQLVAFIALFFEPAVEPGASRPVVALGAVHLAAAACALTTYRGRLPVSVTIVAAYAAFLADWSIAATWNGPLLLASCWIANTAAALPGLTVSGRKTTAIPLVAAWAVPALMVVTRPDLGPELPVGVIVTATSIVLVFWFGLVYPLELVHAADSQESDAQERDELLAAQRAAAQKTAEDARVLHDTVINTLGAIVRGGAAVADGALVRQRCAHDVDTVEALHRGDAELPIDALTVQAAADVPGVTVHFAGMTAHELARSERTLPDGTRRALAGAVAELVRNVGKHSGVSEATITSTRTDGILTLEVADAGRGFDGHAPTGRGLAESVINRAHEQGIDVAVESAAGTGTRVTLTCWQPGSHPSADDDRDAGRGEAVSTEAPNVDLLVSGLIPRAGYAYAVGVTVVGLVLAASNHPGQFTEEYFMVLAIAAVTGVAWVAGRSGRPPGPVVQLLLMLGACFAFWASAAAVDYGRTSVVFWQAIGPIGPQALLLALSRSRAAALTAASLYAATAAGIIGVTSAGNLQAAANVVVAALVGLGLFLGWSRFQRSLVRIGVQAAADQRRAAAQQRELSAQAAAAEARHRWQAAGLSNSITLLRSIAGGADPGDPELRAACGREESYLRKLTQLDPELVHMGRWFANALAEGHASDADVNVHSGSLDLTVTDADRLGELIVQAAKRTGTGERLTATLYPTDDSIRLTLVGPRPRLREAAAGWAGAGKYAVALQDFGEQELLEVDAPRSVYPAPARMARTDQGAEA